MSIYLDEFETLYGISTNIQELKHKIFDLAFEGKLTEQDYSKEEVSNLNNNIKNERNRLIKEKIITKPRGGLEEVNNDEISKSIPDNWKWLKLGEVVHMLTNRKKENGKLPYIVVRVLRGTKEPKTKNKGQIVNKGDYVILVDGENSGEVFTVNQEGYLGSTLRRLKFNKYVNKKYLLLFLKKQHIFLKNRKKGAAIPHLNKTIFRNINFPLPPLEEQIRIVDKIEKLMKEVDKLETKLEEKENISQDLSESIVEAIKSSKDAEELKENLRFIIDNFDVIFKTSESMEEMKNIVLQLAIEGKLVQQDENDESASKLIDKIEKEKKELIKKGKIKDNNRYSIEKIKEIEIPFEIPKSWRWIRSNTLFKEISYGYTASAIKNKTATKLLRISDIQNGKVNWEDVPHCKIEEKDVEKYILKNNDIVIARTGGTVGKSYKIKNINTKAVFASYLIRKVLFEMVNSNYYYLFLQSPLYWEQLIDGTKGAAQPNVNATVLSNLLIPLPPLKEQKKIVQKVNSIMSIIDKLEKELIKKEDLVEKLGSI